MLHPEKEFGAIIEAFFSMLTPVIAALINGDESADPGDEHLTLAGST
jgi:hypothetical protein